MTATGNRETTPGRLERRSRLLAIGAVGLILLSFLFPLWFLHLRAPQYPETLNLYVYAYKFEGSDNPVLNDIQEINTLNHYIGMQEIHQPDFPELKVLPAAIGGSAALILLASAIASWWLLAGATALLAVTGLGGLFSAYSKLYFYGHHLDPHAALKVAGFTPPLVGSNRLVNFTTQGMFGIGGVLLMIAGVLLLAALFWRRKEA